MRPDDLPVQGVEVEHRYVDARGLRTHVAIAGPEDGDPVVLVHGWPQHWWIWREVIPPLVAAGYRCICPDLRGHGWTDAPPDGYEKEQFASDVLAALDELGVERFKLVGHDWGGFAGFLMALREPARVEQLLALSIIHPWIRRDGGPVQTAQGALGASYQFVLSSPVVGRQVVQRTPFINMVLTRGAGCCAPRGRAPSVRRALARAESRGRDRRDLPHAPVARAQRDPGRPLPRHAAHGPDRARSTATATRSFARSGCADSSSTPTTCA